MGGAAPEPGKGSKRSLDAVINLVPYIDMLMTIMTFLIMTAVWTQLATLDVQTAGGGPPPEEKEEEDPDKPKPIIVQVLATGVKVFEKESADITDLPKGPAGYDVEAVRSQLDRFKQARPERVELHLQAEDAVPFQDLVKIIDISKGLQLTGITLQPIGA